MSIVVKSILVVTSLSLVPLLYSVKGQRLVPDDYYTGLQCAHALVFVLASPSLWSFLKYMKEGLDHTDDSKLRKAASLPPAQFRWPFDLPAAKEYNKGRYPVKYNNPVTGKNHEYVDHE